MGDTDLLFLHRPTLNGTAHCSELSLIKEFAAENVMQLIMALKSIDYKTFVLINKNVFLNIRDRLQQNNIYNYIIFVSIKLFHLPFQGCPL